jgi:Putative intracellular protease/amidase
MSKKILIPLPSTDFDPTESAVPWKFLKQHGHHVVFATPDGKPAQCDQIMLHGHGLGLLKSTLMADKNGRSAYLEMEKSAEFSKPLLWQDIRAEDFDGLVLAGGHAPGMKEYLESSLLQNAVVDFFEAAKPVGAICHGVVLAARSQKNGVSVLNGRKTTALLEKQELLAWNLTRLWMKDYYRTYPQTVEAEVRSVLASQEDFHSGPTPLLRDEPGKLGRGFIVKDKNYVSARWPGDAHLFAYEFAEMLKD